MWSLMLFAGIALAETGEERLGPPRLTAADNYPISVVGTLPVDGASGVPLNAGFRLIFSTGDVGPEAWTVTLSSAGEPLEQLQVPLVREYAGDSVLVYFQTAFTPNRAYVVVVANDDWQLPRTVSFTTGDAEVAPLSGDPTILALEAEARWRDSGEWHGQLHLDATAAPDPTGLSVLRVLDEDGRLAHAEYGLDTSEASTSFLWTQRARRGEEACFRVVQEDTTGTRSAASASACVALERPTRHCGLRSASASGFGWLAFGLFVPLRRRGRRGEGGGALVGG